jgi:hypothetical protein
MSIHDQEVQEMFEQLPLVPLCDDTKLRIISLEVLKGFIDAKMNEAYYYGQHDGIGAALSKTYSLNPRENG